ncbi:MAG: hypothetical protein SPI30_03605 [Prevotella sp.]|nr:hypothetical protein [Prevotella sp.]
MKTEFSRDAKTVPVNNSAVNQRGKKRSAKNDETETKNGFRGVKRLFFTLIFASEHQLRGKRSLIEGQLMNVCKVSVHLLQAVFCPF